MNGNFKNIEIKSPNLAVDSNNSMIDTLLISSQDSTVNLGNKSYFKNINLLGNADKTKMFLNGNSENLTIDSKDNNIYINGKIKNLDIKANSVDSVIKINQNGIVQFLNAEVLVALKGSGIINKFHAEKRDYLQSDVKINEVFIVEDENAKNEVETLIKDLPKDLALDNKSNVDNARVAFDNLTIEQKALVRNDVLNSLENAEANIVELEIQEAKIIEVKRRAIEARQNAQNQQSTDVKKPTINQGGTKLVAFTFDDGPNSNVTNRIIDAFSNVGGHGTFFVLGNNVAKERNTITRIYENGHQIGNHSYNHKDLTTLNKADLDWQINTTNSEIQSIIGATPTIVRPTYGKVNNFVVNNVNYPLINWNIDTLDWKYRDSQSIFNIVMNNIHANSIVLFHDIYPTTASAIEILLPRLSEMGYQFVTIEQLAAYNGINLRSHNIYYSMN